MRRFFTTFFLLTGVACSLVISENYFKNQNQQFSAKNNNTEIDKSIDLTEADIYDSKRNSVRVSLTN
ncbi:hypothetical protein MATR_22130 [Marivirga tractuosa]|uniref:Uncharacterized protein n=1 Tax=Marivirga tractuosa (strain ATCC 23168 / DSM 4126 / NBRC 15989 / NCIMB 1408 / VKM B-1430 / H-43) TaxID=643867 RepID=E4TKJ1_MARTH|nr:hypothetical protein [Marivirga tractuosa]ADR20171.1 hypothetical protein Ftrac_0160 [Marivirga tractuosa DSM 4126]BDD15388.1 hypothetical protein MATR_22130 [Marivirga tractuosa]